MSSNPASRRSRAAPSASRALSNSPITLNAIVYSFSKLLAFSWPVSTGLSSIELMVDSKQDACQPILSSSELVRFRGLWNRQIRHRDAMFPLSGSVQTRPKLRRCSAGSKQSPSCTASSSCYTAGRIPARLEMVKEYVVSRPAAQQHSTWYVVIVAIFVTCLIISNIIAVKLVSIWGLTVPAGLVIFPISYICGDVLTEVYGFRRARQVIWIGFGCNIFA